LIWTFFSGGIWERFTSYKDKEGNSKIPPQPLFVRAFANHKMVMFMIIWLFGNIIASGLTNNGAFEMYYQNKTAWSSLKKGRMPQYNDIFNGCKRVGLEMMSSSASP